MVFCNKFSQNLRSALMAALWFDDGNILVWVGNTVHKLHTSVIQRETTRLDDFHFRSSPPHDYIEDPPILKLTMPENHFNHFINVLYNSNPWAATVRYRAIANCLQEILLHGANNSVGSSRGISECRKDVVAYENPWSWRPANKHDFPCDLEGLGIFSNREQYPDRCWPANGFRCLQFGEV